MSENPNQSDQPTDLSQKTVVVLVVLTVLISVFGTVAVLSEANTIKTYSQVQTKAPTKAEVKLEVINPNDRAALPNSGLATGRVALEVVPPKT